MEYLQRQDDSEHELAKEIRNFSKNLGDLFGMPVVLLDESYTSVESENFLSTMGVKGRDQKAYVDSHSCCNHSRGLF